MLVGGLGYVGKILDPTLMGETIYSQKQPRKETKKTSFFFCGGGGGKTKIKNKPGFICFLALVSSPKRSLCFLGVFPQKLLQKLDPTKAYDEPEVFSKQLCPWIFHGSSSPHAGFEAHCHRHLGSLGPILGVFFVVDLWLVNLPPHPNKADIDQGWLRIGFP